MQLIRAIACAGVSIRWLPQPAWSFPVGRIHCCCGRSAGAAALVYAMCSCRNVKQGPRARRVGVYETTGGARQGGFLAESGIACSTSHAVRADLKNE